MFDTNELYRILKRCCGQLRKGEVLQGDAAMVDWASNGDADKSAPGGVLEVFMMPKNDDPAFAELEKVDVHFVTVAVDKGAAEIEKENFISVLNAYPYPDRLAAGPSYIEVGGVIGDQGAAFEMFALGKVLGLWSIITPETMGLYGEAANQLAGSGFIMMSGYTHNIQPS